MRYYVKSTTSRSRLVREQKKEERLGEIMDLWKGERKRERRGICEDEEEKKEE